MISPAAPWRFCETARFPIRAEPLHAILYRRAALDRGMAFKEISTGLYCAEHPSGAHFYFSARAPSTQGLVAREIAKDKAATQAVLSRAGFCTADGKDFAARQRDQARAYFKTMTSAAVVKPVDGSGGLGVTVNIATDSHFEEAWKLAVAGPRPRVVVERYIIGNDHRIFVIGDRVVAAARRHPAYVVGDGIHTIEELVRLKSEQRAALPYVGAKPISITTMMDRNLREAGMSRETVLAAGQRWQLHAVANIGGGGESEDVTDILHPGFAKIAIAVRQAVPGLSYTGIDLLAADISRSPDDQDWAICEINGTPDFALHHFPVMGQGRDIAGLLMDEMTGTAFDGHAARKAVHLRVTGKVTGAGFRRWLQGFCGTVNIHGWVRNTDDGAVEAYLSGTAAAVDAVIAACKSGPKSARPAKVDGRCRRG